MYGYIDHNRQFVRPDSVGHNDITIIAPTDEELAELGYLLRVDTEPPAESGYVSYYVEIDGKAVQHWKPCAIPDEGATVWDELDAAYQAGYNEGYTEGVNGAYDQ